ncbi:MAG: PolC-type DNA polymerase III [Clostridia bacterium]|nr:PolC-type DNA polymerase III [Clostridia bacterium]
MKYISDFYVGQVNDFLQKAGTGEIVKIDVNRKRSSVVIFARYTSLMRKAYLYEAQKYLQSTLRLNKVHIIPYYDKNLFIDKYFSQVVLEAKFRKPVFQKYVNKTMSRIKGNTIEVVVIGANTDYLKDNGFCELISEVIEEEFGLHYKVKLIDPSDVGIQSDETPLEAPPIAPEPSDEDVPPPEEYPVPEPTESEAQPQQSVPMMDEEELVTKIAVRDTKKVRAIGEICPTAPIYPDGAVRFFGRELPKENPVSIKEISGKDGRFTIWGDIFDIETRETRTKKVIIDIKLTDYTSSLKMKIMRDAADAAKVLKDLYVGQTILTVGKHKFDDFEKTYVFEPYMISAVKKAQREDTSARKRVELHLHTSMSEMDGMTSAKYLVERAAAWGHKAIAVTDHGVIQALPEAYAAAKKHGIKLILGMEGYLVDDELYPDFMTMKRGEYRRHHIILLVKEDTSLDNEIDKEDRAYGRKNLYELISHSNVKTFRTRPLIPKSLLASKREGLLIGSACELGELIQAILRGESEETLESIAAFYDYLEIQPNGNNSFMLRSEREPYTHIHSEEDLIKINQKVIELADKLGKLVVATGDVHFLDEKDAKFRSILQYSKGFTDADSQAPLYFKTTDEMLDDFAWAGERASEFVIDNPNKIADLVADDIPPIPPGTFQPHIDGAEQELTDSCWQRAKEFYGDPVPDHIAQRLQRELDSIISHGYAVLYVIAKRLVAESERRGYLVGSRGSVGSSLVAHFGGISEVNPLPPHYYCKKCKHSEFFLHGEYGSGFDLPPKNCPQCGEPLKRDGHEIPFETFLGFDGDKEPDIDLNFSGDVQSEIHRFTEELFGKEYVFKAGTMATVADKTAFGYVKKYLDEHGVGETTPKAEIDRLTIGCTGIKRTTGQHPGGMVVVPSEYTVEDFTPIQYPSNDAKKGTYTTHFDFKNSLHDTLLKLDELGHDNPTIYKFLETSTGIPVMDADLSDPKIYELIVSTEPLGVREEDIDCPTGTLGIPEMGTPFVIGMLTDAKPKTFADLLQISGLSHGTDVWLGNAQDLINNKICTISDVIGCRDDIMTHLIHVAENYEQKTGNKSPLSKKDCFSIMEYTRKGKAPKMLPPFEQAMKTIGVEQWYIDSCYKIKYMFPKAHAAAYVIAALRIAWYKIYYPIHFYSAFFTVRGEDIDATAAAKGLQAVKARMAEINAKGKEASDKEKAQNDILKIVVEMLARGYEFLPVDIKKSDWRVYRIEGNKLRLPFSALDGVGTTAAKAIYDAVQAQGDEAFISKEDFATKSGVSTAVITALDAFGALDDLPDSNQVSLFEF